MPARERGSLTKELPLSQIDATVALITPGMAYSALRAAASAKSSVSPTEQAPHRDAPGLLRNRFLLVGDQNEIQYDAFISLVAAHGITSPLVRKVMYFVWAWRDERIRRFVLEEIADKSGRWSAQRAKDKKRANFFRQFSGTAESAKKARSNFEFFLSGTGVLSGSGVTLRPVESWLPSAMQVAAQHEPDPAVRARMLHDPVGTLFELGLNALADLTTADRSGVGLGPTTTAEEQESDDQLPSVPKTGGDAKDWKDRAPGTSPPPTAPKTVANNAVALERATSSHLMLERVLAKALSQAGLKPQYTSSIDMLTQDPSAAIVCEIKSCTDRNFHGQVRRGVSQLLEYRWLYRNMIPTSATLILLVETRPPKRKEWLVEYLRSVGVELVWKQHGSDALVMHAPVPSYLTALVGVA